MVFVAQILLMIYVSVVDCTEITANFEGKEYVEYQINNNLVVTRKDKVTLKFKTTEAYGVLLYSCGMQGDFLLLELKRGKILYTGDFGSTYEKSGKHEITLNQQYNDNKWHSVTLLRENGTHVYLTVDGVTNSRYNTDLDFKQLNLDQYLYVGGLSASQKLDKSCLDISKKKNFIGCLSNVRFNSLDLLYGAHEKFTGYKSYGDLAFKCPNINNYDVIGLVSEASTLTIKRNILDKNDLNITLDLRTFEPNGHLLKLLCTNGAIDIAVIEGKVRLTLSFLGLGTNDAVRIQSDTKIDDGDWHLFTISVKREQGLIYLKIDKDLKVYQFKAHFKLDKELGLFMRDIKLGGNTPSLPGLVACFRIIRIGSKTIYFNASDVTTKNSVLNQCQIKDLCFPNPCQHASTCTQSRSQFHCDCANTEYKGKKCETCIHKKTCAELKESGETKSGHYKLCSNNERIFRAYCDMKTGATVIKHSLRNDTRVANGKIVQLSTVTFYIHNINYFDATIETIKDLFNVSLSCRQYIRYDCYRSRLLFDVGRYRHVHYKGARWVSRESEIQHYWGGATPESRKCGCGMNGSCAKDEDGRRKDCNCDVGDEKWRFDAGFLTDKNRLPVTQVQFSQGPETFDDSFFSVGQLECAGTIPKPTVKPTTTSTTKKLVKPTEINIHMFFNLTDELGNPLNNSIITETIKNGNIDSLFSKPWLITIVTVGAVLCLLLIFLLLLLFRQHISHIFMKCIYGKHYTKPRIEIEDYNRYSTASEENSDWDIYRLSTSFPTSTPEPSYCLTDEESVNMRVRTLDDVRGKKRLKRLSGWGSRTASAPTVVGSVKSLKTSKKELDDQFIILETSHQKGNYSSKPYETSGSSKSLNTLASIDTDQALSTTATDGDHDSTVVDTNSEYSNKSSEHSHNSSLKESECSLDKKEPPKTLNVSKTESGIKRLKKGHNNNNKRTKMSGKSNNIGRNGVKTLEDHVKAYYPVLPINGFVHTRQPVLRHGTPVDYSPHMCPLSTGTRLVPLNRRPSTNFDGFQHFSHPPTIEERSDESEDDGMGSYGTPVDGYYDLCGEEHDSPTSETRLLFDDVNKREEVEREADEKIKLLKRKVIEKATYTEECA